MPRYLRLFNIIAIAVLCCATLIFSSAPDHQNYGTDNTQPPHNREIMLSTAINFSESQAASDNDVMSIFSLAPITVQTLPENSITPTETSTPEDIIPFPADSGLPLPETTSNTVAPQPRAEPSYREVWALVTAYCPCSRCCGRGSPGRTSLGKTAWRPGIAADPRAIAYGTRISIDGYGLREVDDTGGAMRQSWTRRGIVHLDIRMTYHWQAKAWGRKLMKVKIYNRANQ